MKVVKLSRTVLINLYRAARREIGPRGWWPSTPDGKFVPEYNPDPKRELSEKDRFEIALGAILTQNTSWSNVTRALEMLNRIGELTFFGVYRMPVEKLKLAIRSTGYFNQKAIKVHEFCVYVALEWRGRLTLAMKEKLPELRRKLLSIHGVGPETADSILLYALEKPIFVIDAYTRRIFARHGLARVETPYDDLRLQIESLLTVDVSPCYPSPYGRGKPPSTARGRVRERLSGLRLTKVQLFNDYHAQLVEVAKRWCKKNTPLCSECPLYKKSLFVKGSSIRAPRPEPRRRAAP